MPGGGELRTRGQGGHPRPRQSGGGRDPGRPHPRGEGHRMLLALPMVLAGVVLVQRAAARKTDLNRPGWDSWQGPPGGEGRTLPLPFGGDFSGTVRV